MIINFKLIKYWMMKRKKKDKFKKKMEKKSLKFKKKIEEVLCCPSLFK
jgi:hypothetical protein